MKSLNLSLLLACIACMSAGNLVAQDYTTKTLSFEDVTSTNLNFTPYSGANEKEIEFADYDMDGDLDAVVATARNDFTQRRNKLYRNDNGVLNDVTNSVIPGFMNTDTSRSAYMRDFTGDGFPDIIVINDSNSGTGQNDSPGKTKFYRNVNGTSFVNESQRLDNQTGAACNGTVADFDNNGALDLMMVNYPNTTQDSLGLNGVNGNAVGQFDDVTFNNMPSDGNYGVHGESADMNGDGKVDILITNRTNQPSYIYYNNLNNQGSGDGDFRYGGGGTAGRYIVPDTSGGVLENAMVPADFNNDGMMDFYYANAGTPGSSTGDAIYINTGNNANGFAQFDVVPLSSELNGESYKVTVSDLDQDGRVDAVVMSENRRPYILRNITEGDDVAFVDWTPSMFNSADHEGWQANMADITGNGRDDILVGSLNDGDFLFQNIDSELTEFDTLTNGILPSFVNAAPIAITGEIAAGETLTFLATTIPPTAKVSVLTRSADADLSIEVSSNGIPLGSSDRGAADVDEAVTFNQNTTNAIFIEVTNNGILLGDVNMDGAVNLVDVAPFVAAVQNGDFIAEADMNSDGAVNLLDVAPFVDALSSGGGGSGGSGTFVAEFIGRTN